MRQTTSMHFKQMDSKKKKLQSGTPYGSEDPFQELACDRTIAVCTKQKI